VSEGSAPPDVERRIRSVLADVFELDADQVGADTSMDTVEQWDSLQQLTLVLSLEEEFGVQFDDEETVALVSYPLIVAIVGDRLTGESPG
jgi:acyl carrier protein